MPGFNWCQVLVIGRKGPPTLAHLRWWSNRGGYKSSKREQEKQILHSLDTLWGKQVRHIWDRGFADNPWLTLAFTHAARFVLRWPKNYRLMDAEGRTRKPGEISKGKRSWEYRHLWDARKRCLRKVGIIAFPVSDPIHQQPLWLVPWYLLTTQPIRCPEDAWQIVHAYVRRWQVEMAIRFSKSEIAFESPRLIHWQHRKKITLDCHPCLCFSLIPPVTSARYPALLDLAYFLPSYRKAEPGYSSSALSSASRYFLVLVFSSPSLSL